MDETRKYCVLFDAENISLSKVNIIFKELSKYGDTPIRKIYGDFSNKNDNKWKEVCRDYAITPMQTYNFTTGKNSVDMALAIDGMEILYTKPYITGIVIVSSDSDFTGLAKKWKELGKSVIGIGEKKTPSSLRSACSTFIYLEALLPDDELDAGLNEDIDTVTQELKDQVKKIIEDNNGDMLISALKEQIQKINNDFDVRNYGYKKVLEFFKNEFDFLEVYEEKKNLYRVRLRNRESTDELKAKITAQIIEIVSKSKNGKINMGDLNNKLKEQNLNYEDTGYTKLKKLIETINELKISGTDVKLKK